MPVDSSGRFRSGEAVASPRGSIPEDGGYITAVHAGCPHWKPLSPSTFTGLSRFHRDPLSG